MPTTPPEFWKTKTLQHIKMGALSAIVSPDAVLHAVLARVAAFTSHNLLLPPIIGGQSPLNYFAAIVAPSGGGKSSAAKAAARLLPAPAHLEGRDILQVGTGEGLIESFLEKDPDTGEKVQMHNNLFVYVDEGEILRKYARRDGTTLDVVIRTAHSGGALGQHNASKATSRFVSPNSYRLGLVVGFQPQKAGALLTPESVDGGTPQRFVWAAGQISQSDRIKMDDFRDRFEWPGELRLPSATWNREGEVKISPLLVRAIQDYQLDVLSGREAPAHPLDAHETLITLRMAVLLGLLEGRPGPNSEDHERARTLWRVNAQVRRWVVKEVQNADQDELNEQIRRDMQRAQAQVVAREWAPDNQRRLREQVLRIVEKHGGEVTAGVLQADVTRSLRPMLTGTLQQMSRSGEVVLHQQGSTVKVALPDSDEIVLDLSEAEPGSLSR